MLAAYTVTYRSERDGQTYEVNALATDKAAADGSVLAYLALACPGQEFTILAVEPTGKPADI